MIIPDLALALPGLPPDKSLRTALLPGRRSRLSNGLLKRLTDLLESRLEDLHPDERALLQLVAFSETLGRFELETLSDPEVAESLERRGLLVCQQSGRRLELRVAHRLHREIVRTSVSAARKHAIYRSLAEIIEATGAQRETDSLRVASWRLVCGGGRPDVMLDGAHAAYRRHDLALAEELARAAMGADRGRSAHVSFEAALLAAQLTGLQGRTEHAERELAALAARASDDDQRGRVALTRLDNSVTWTGIDELGILDEAEATIGDSVWQEKLRARRLRLVLHSRGPRAAAKNTGRLLDQKQGRIFVSTWIIRAYSLSRLGQLRAALDAASDGQVAEFMTSTTPLTTGTRGWPVAIRCLALAYGGRFEEAEALAAHHYDVASAERSTEAQAVFAIMRAAPVGERGHVQTAAHQTREAIALSGQVGRPLMVHLCHLYGALALALGGRAQDAADAIAAARDLNLPAVLHNKVDFLQAQAWTASARGHLPEARRQLERAADLGEEIGDLVGKAAALHGLARLGQAKAVRTRLGTATNQIEGVLAPARLAHTEALADNDPVKLEGVSRDFEAMGADLLAAEAAADAAVVRRRAGEAQKASAAERRAGLLAERCEGARTPALQAIDVRGRLTLAEWETALMAAHGYPSRQIADEMCLAVRTIENRLQRSYDKIGISSRTELAEALNLAPTCLDCNEQPKRADYSLLRRAEPTCSARRSSMR